MVPAIGQNLALCGIQVFPCWDNKQPALKDGFNSASTIIGEYWPSNIIGIPVPKDVFIIDVDLYKGVTTEAIDTVLGAPLDWDKSFIQSTPRGGRHYAFRCSEYLKQGSDHFKDLIGKGFDTRTTGRGYICTGESYSQAPNTGIFALANIDQLPTLPTSAIDALRVPDNATAVPQPLPDGDRNTAEIGKMLESLDADCSRDEWLRVGLALKHQFHDSDDTGWILFNNWSMTGSDQYDAAECKKLWNTISPARDSGQPTVTMGSLVHIAIKNGYIPGMSAAEAFGAAEPGVPLADVESLVLQINEQGGSPEKIDELTTAIRTMPCSDIQRAALTATLQRVLRINDMKITEADLKKATSPTSSKSLIIPQPSTISSTHFTALAISPINGLGTVHIQNATMLREAIFTNKLVRNGSEPYWWSGRYWEPVRKVDLASKVAHAFIGSEYGKDSNITGTRNQLINIIPTRDNLGRPDARIYFKNGVYDPARPDLGMVPHHMDNLNTSTLSVEFDTSKQHPAWDKFLNDCFGVEPERITLLQEIMGWWLISDDLNHQKAVAFDGVPRSCKGTILQVIAAILGDALIDVSIIQLADNKPLSGMRNAILAVDRDAKRPPQRDASTVHSNFNKITSNEPISIPLLFAQDPWRGPLNCKIAIACNGIPVMIDDSGASPSRWVVLKFTESRLGREDLSLGKRLVAEKTAIAAWAVQGLTRLMMNGKFTLPQSSIEESHALTDGSSPLMEFADERLEIGPEHSIHGGLLWDTFRQWCNSTNNRLPSRGQFLRSLERALQSQGVHYKKSLRIGSEVRTGLCGVRLRILDSSNVTPFKPQEVATSE